MNFKVIEVNNPLAVHCITDTKERAEHWIKIKAPIYIEKGYFMDKELTKESFKIIEVRDERIK